MTTANTQSNGMKGGIMDEKQYKGIISMLESIRLEIRAHRFASLLTTALNNGVPVDSAEVQELDMGYRRNLRESDDLAASEIAVSKVVPIE